MEFLLVKFPQVRDVLADGDVIGDTNTTLMLPAGEYLITLSGDGYSPDEQDIVLNGTSGNDPKVIVFTLAEVSVPSTGVARGAPTAAPRAVAPTKPKAKASGKAAAKRAKAQPKAKAKSAAKKPKAKASSRDKRTGKSKSKRKSR